MLFQPQEIAARYARKVQTSRAGGLDFSVYRDDPEGYARDMLGIGFLWEPIAAALRALLEAPFCVDVDSGHNVGKTHAAAIAANWWYDSRNPGVVISTAPTQDDVEKLLWAEIRMMRQAAHARDPRFPLDLMPAAPAMRSGENHYAYGKTARKGESFQGRHRQNMLFIFDEKEGVEGQYFTGVTSMFRPGTGDAWLRIGNPTTTTSPAYQERRRTGPDGKPSAHLIRLSSLEHPNIRAGLAGEALPVPGAVTPEQVDRWVQDWCDPIPAADRKPGDFEWRGRLYRPGPIGQPRILGLRPSAGTFGIWSEALWDCTLGPEPSIPLDVLPRVGCDCANYGTDYTVFHARWGAVSLSHQAVNGWDVVQIAARLREIVRELAAMVTSSRDKSHAPVDPHTIPIQIDDDANGRAVSALLARRQVNNGENDEAYRVVRCNASSGPRRPDLYARIRSELWFMAAKKAAIGLLNLSRIDQTTRKRIEMQALAPEWWPDQAGRREVESKDDLRDVKRMGRSPDDMDALNLAYYEPASGPDHTWAAPAPPPSHEPRQPPAREVGEWAPELPKLWGKR